MPFERPTLQELIDRIKADVATHIPGADVQLRRGNLQVLPTVQAGAVHLLYGYLDFMAAQVMPDTAEAEFLERHAAIWGVQRKAAAKASGSATISGQAGAVLPAGQEFRRGDGVLFLATAEHIMTGTSGQVAVEAVETGATGNAAAGVGLTLSSPVIGMNTLAAVAEPGLSGGVDRESDALLLQRLLRRIQEPPHGGASHDYVAWALEVAGVTRAWCLPGHLGAGTVGLVFTTDDSPAGPIPSAGDVEAVQAYLEPLRPVTAQVTAFAPTPVELNPEITITPDTTKVRAAVEAELADLLRRESEPGGAMLVSHVREAVSSAAGEADHALLSPLADITVAAGELLVLGTITWS